MELDAPIREVADAGGVGLGALYWHVPRCWTSPVPSSAARSTPAPTLAEAHAPLEALASWMQRYAAFVATKRGLAQALHSGNTAFDSLPGYLDQRLRPALRSLLANATAADVVRTDIDVNELLSAVASLCISTCNTGPGQVGLLVGGMRLKAGGVSESGSRRAEF